MTWTTSPPCCLTVSAHLSSERPALHVSSTMATLRPETLLPEICLQAVTFAVVTHVAAEQIAFCGQ